MRSGHSPLFYSAFRAVVAWALALFYRTEVAGSLASTGAVIYVGNHPNGLIDPALVFAAAPRHLTFLGKAPLFSMPVLGSVLRALGALPVYRKQDDPSQMAQNAGTLDAAVAALRAGGAITLFPEGKSHSEPHLAELKTGCARIALRARANGPPVTIVPVGLTYARKERYRSHVLVQVGATLEVEPPAEGPPDAPQAVNALTLRIEAALREVTLNLEAWEDLPLLDTASRLYALRTGQKEQDLARVRAFGDGLALLRREQPERLAALRPRVEDFRRRLFLVQASVSDLALLYRPAEVARFVVRNLVALLGLPIFALGMAAFALPYQLPWLASKLTRAEDDLAATVKLLVALVVTPLWWALSVAVFGLWRGWPGALWALVATPLLALFTRAYFEHRAEALRDARTFFVLGSRTSLKARLLAEGETLAREVAALAQELGDRVGGASGAAP